MHIATPNLTIRRLRIHATGGDWLGSRRRWERAFAAADPVPPALADEGILLLRHVAWRAGRQRLRDLRSFLVAAQERAVRPAEGTPAANADAVWFRDESELLFCLARDWLAGGWTGHWWWAALGFTVASDSVVRRWLASPRSVPAAIERLALEAIAEAFLAALEPRVLEALACAVADTFALPLLRASAEARAEDTSTATGAMPVNLLDLVGETPPKASAPAQALWVMSLLLVRRPALVRSHFIERAFREWFTPPAMHDLARSREAADLVSSPVSKPNAEHPAGRAGPDLAKTFKARTSESALPGSEQPIQTQQQRRAAVAEASSTLRASDFAEGGIIAQTPGAPTRPAQRKKATLVSVAVSAQVPPAREPTLSDDAGAPALSVRTVFGGVFYLINVALGLGIYSDFTRPRAPNLALSPFDWLALLATHWFAIEFEADPLAPLLARLAGRQPADKPACPEAIPNPVDWLRLETQRVHGRLVAGLPESFARELPGCVCRQDAEVRVRALRVEVRYSLAAHPIELRLSGLDRDPGWLPAAGRAIYFLYD